MAKFTYIKPTRLIGNIYFVGSKEASCHVIDTGDGLIMIDTGYDINAKTVMDNMADLGLNIADVKIIIHSHGHYDHTDATAELLKHAVGAKTYLNFRDIKYIRGFTPDYDIKDGDIIRLGSCEILCLHTPGHTEGTTSFFWNVTADDKTYRCGMFGGAGTNQVMKSYLQRNRVPYTTRGDFYRSLERLNREHVDVFIGNHAWNNKTMEKVDAIAAGADRSICINPEEWGNFLALIKRKLDAVILMDSRDNFVTYAHRGASEYCPENTLLSFYTGIYMGANGIETDVRRTKDGALVLFHDGTLERVCGVEGRICDYTLEELSQFRAKCGTLEDKIPTLDDFLRLFAHFPITFAIELKDAGIEREVADAMYRHGVEKKTIVTSFGFENIKAIKEYNPEVHIGWLTKDVSDEAISKLLSIGGEQLCPIGSAITPELVAKCHKLGLDVRAWGINHENYKQVYDAGADGMTINFPDLMLSYIAEKKEQNG